jgi:hypothetical protein
MEPDGVVDAYLDALPEPERTTSDNWPACGPAPQWIHRDLSVTRAAR